MELDLAASADVVLFDLDDTILDFGGSVEVSWRATCARAAEERPGLDPVALHAAIRHRRDWFWSDPGRHRAGRADLRAATRSIVTQALVSIGRDDPAFAAVISDRYRDLREASIRLIPGALETLTCLRARRVRLGLVTNGARADQRAKIERFRLDGYFDYIGVEGELGFGKPDPQAFEAALAALCCTAESCWMVGDNLEWDVAAPQRLGLRAVWVDASGEGLPPQGNIRPDGIVRSIADLDRARGNS